MKKNKLHKYMEHRIEDFVLNEATKQALTCLFCNVTGAESCNIRMQTYVTSTRGKGKRGKVVLLIKSN